MTLQCHSLTDTGWHTTIPDVFLHPVRPVILRVRAVLSASGAAALGPARPPSGAGSRRSHGGARRSGERKVPELRPRRSRRAALPLRAAPGRAGAGPATVPGRSGARALLTPFSPSSQHPQGRVAAQRHGPGPVSAAPLPSSPEAAPEGRRGRVRRGGAGAGARPCRELGTTPPAPPEASLDLNFVQH